MKCKIDKNHQWQGESCSLCNKINLQILKQEEKDLIVKSLFFFEDDGKKTKMMKADEKIPVECESVRNNILKDEFVVSFADFIFLHGCILRYADMMNELGRQGFDTGPQEFKIAMDIMQKLTSILNNLDLKKMV